MVIIRPACIMLSVILVMACNRINPSLEVQRLVDGFLEDHQYFEEAGDVWGSYTLDLTVEAIINYSLLTGDSSYNQDLARFFHNRNYKQGDTVDYRNIPFSDCYFNWFLLHPDPAFIGPYIEESRRMMKELHRTEEGAICIHHDGGNYMLIDYLQSYAMRMARTGFLSGDTAFYRECISQFRIYRDLLRYDDSGLYSQGRGWLDDRSLNSPACWSRGQGWLIRGMAGSLEYLPKGSSFYLELEGIFKNLCDALLAKQDAQGMWHTLPCLSADESYPEVSGTGLIAQNLAKAYRMGFLDETKYRDAALHAMRGIMDYIDRDGNISHISKGPGPLRETGPWKEKGVINDPHGLPAVLFALNEEILIDSEFN